MGDENSVEIPVLLAVDEAIKRINSLEGRFAQFSGNTEGFLKNLNVTWSSFVGNLAADTVVKAFEMAEEAAKKFFDVFILDGIKAAQDAQVAVNDLNVALAINGKFTKETTKSLQDFDESLQSVTTSSHNQIEEGQALLENMGHLDEQGLKRATKAALDLSAGLNIDLRTAFELVGKSSEGTVTGLQKLGIKVQQGTDNVETFRRTLTLLENNFGGAAQGKVATYAGAIAQASNSFEDLQETSGGFIVRNPLVIKLINDTSSAFRDMATWIQHNQDSILKFVDTGLVGAVQGLGYLMIGLDGTIRFLSALWKTGGLVFDLLIGAVANMASSMLFFIEKAFGWVPGLGPKLKEAQIALEGFSKGAKDQLLEDGKAIGDTFSNQGVIGKVGDALIGYGNKLQKFAEKNNQLQSTMVTSTKNAVQKQKDLIEQLTDFYSGANAHRIDDLKSTLGSISELQKSGSRELFEVGKQAAAASAVIDGISGVQKALGSAPPPINFVLAALVGIAAAVNVAKIESTQFAGAEGGIVPGNQTSGDLVQARLNSREGVLTLDDQKNLFNAIRGGGLGGGGGTVNHITIQGNVDSEATIIKLGQQLDHALRYRGLKVIGINA